MPINIPQPTNNDSSLFTIIGGIGGAILGGPAGAVTGMGVGQTVGGIISPQKSQLSPIGQVTSQSEAMARRSQADAENSLQTLKQAEAALPSLPEEMRQEYAPAIIQARMMAEQRNAYA